MHADGILRMYVGDGVEHQGVIFVDEENDLFACLLKSDVNNVVKTDVEI